MDLRICYFISMMRKEIVMKKICPDCGSDNVVRKETDHTYFYGEVELTSHIPYFTCKCSHCWIDYEAEDIKDRDIKKYKNRRDSNV
jgi:hypothetical protein